MEKSLGEILGDVMRDSKPKRDPILATQAAQIWMWSSLVTNEKIRAIKYLRGITGISLKDAKDACESVDGFMIPYPIAEMLKNQGDFTYQDQRQQKNSIIRIFC